MVLAAAADWAARALMCWVLEFHLNHSSGDMLLHQEFDYRQSNPTLISRWFLMQFRHATKASLSVLESSMVPFASYSHHSGKTYVNNTILQKHDSNTAFMWILPRELHSARFLSRRCVVMAERAVGWDSPLFQPMHFVGFNKTTSKGPLLAVTDHLPEISAVV